MIEPDFAYPEKGTPIGYAVPGKKILLLDDNGQEVKRDEVGEIAVKSRYLATGYWRQPELTRAKFLPDPQGGDERIYLTGDLGQMLPNGFLVHLGRKDFMVKIRGYRVNITAGTRSPTLALCAKQAQRNERLYYTPGGKVLYHRAARR